MKNNIEINAWKFSMVEYEAIASFLWCDVYDVIRIYEKFNFAGLGMIILSNYYLTKNELVMGKINDLEKIATAYNNDGAKILNYLFSSRFYEKKGDMYYSKNQLIAMKRESNISERYIDSNKKKLHNKHTVFPPANITKISYMQKVINNIIARVNSPLPQHIKNEIKAKQGCVRDINVENFYRLMNAYISIDSSFIAFTDMVDMLMKILHKEGADIKNLLNNSRIWEYDSKLQIIYDPYQRELNHMSRIPSMDEVRETSKRRLGRYRIILNLK